MQANAQKVQRRLANKPRHPAELAADVVERVIATGGEGYLNTQEPYLSWWQLSLLDVKLFLAACLAVLTALLYGAVCLLTRCAKAMKRGQGNHSTVYKKVQ